MLVRPTWKNNLRVELLAPDMALVFSERGHHVLKGQLYYQMAPYLDGTHTIQRLADRMGAQTPYYRVHHAVHKLQKKGFVTEKAEHHSREFIDLCHSFGLDVDQADARLSATQLAVHAVDGIDRTALSTSLSRAGLILSDERSANLHIVLTDDYLSPDVEAFHRQFWSLNIPWLLVKPVGTILLIGPLFDETQCWECLAQRLRLHRRLERTYQIETGRHEPLPPPQIAVAPLTNLAYALCAAELLKWVIRPQYEALSNHIIQFDTEQLDLTQHRFVKRPQCPTCGDATLVARRALQPVTLTSRRKAHTTDGGYRGTTPADTAARLAHHVSPVTGVVQALVKRDNGAGQDIIHTYASGVNIRYEAENYGRLRGLIRSGDGGKGASDAQSKASALCEALERYSGSYQGDEFSIEASYRELGEQAIHPNDCMHFSHAQLHNQTAGNRVTKGANTSFVGWEFDETAVIPWTPVWSLTHQAFKYLPTSFCYFGNFKDKSIASFGSSNGNAAGNTLEEAILQGFMELVERDGVAIWWYNRLQRPAVDIASFENDYANRLCDYYEGIDRDLWVLDVTSDLGIPAFAAISRRRHAPREEILYGFGAHFDPQIALLRSLTEVNQILSGFIAVGDGNLPEFNDESDAWWQTATIANQPYLAPDNRQAPRRRQAFPHQWHDDLRDDVLRCVAIAREHGMEMLVLDQTQPDVELNVVKVIVPGMRHFWRRLGPGRLYDVPVKMGWLSEPRREDELNPFSVFL